ncbi:hypothetical protein KC326_g200 [Hortaea werneckii]|nr:hypothetical protein KC326_g200 [Hortaea werneckii]
MPKAINYIDSIIQPRSTSPTSLQDRLIRYSVSFRTSLPRLVSSFSTTHRVFSSSFNYEKLNPQTPHH